MGGAAVTYYYSYYTRGPSIQRQDHKTENDTPGTERQRGRSGPFHRQARLTKSGPRKPHHGQSEPNQRSTQYLTIGTHHQNVLVVGGSGRLGQQLVNALLQSGCTRIRVAVRPGTDAAEVGLARLFPQV